MMISDEKTDTEKNTTNNTYIQDIYIFTIFKAKLITKYIKG